MVLLKLDDRKVKILHAIIQSYLETGEPVGSRTIAKLNDIKLSSATIRNEMADLEEMGYIMQPHTSAGRIPSDKGYRFYVDLMLEDKKQEVEDMKAILLEKADKMEVILQQVAKMLAVNTNYTSVISTPQYKHKIKFIQLTALEEYKILAVIVLEGNIIKNKIIKLNDYIDNEITLKLNIIINTYLQGLDISEINIPVISQIKEQGRQYEDILNLILDVIVNVMAEAEDIELYTSGATNILRYPELSDTKKAADIIYTIEEKKVLTEFLQDKLEDEDNRGIQVYIGDETPVKSMEDCSVVTATYEIEEGVYGKIGIIGPKRMDYKKVVNTLQGLMVQLDDIFKDKTI